MDDGLCHEAEENVTNKTSLEDEQKQPHAPGQVQAPIDKHGQRQ